MNILLVDYDTDSRAGIAGFLREMGHHVTERGSVEDAYATYIEGDFSMVLTDIKMPAMLGEDLLHRINALPGEKQMSFYLLIMMIEERLSTYYGKVPMIIY